MYSVLRTPEFADWLIRLTDNSTKGRLNARLGKAKRGLLGDVKSVGGKVYEMREDFGPGWRMYYTRRGNKIVMLAGGDKSTQSQDIARAQELVLAIEENNEHQNST